ncbi:MAG: xylulokinase [Anaerolineales bacterium]|nr:xylulokinase [Anaerolineales bacterium]
MTLLLGIDIGTSSAKAVLFDPETAQTAAVAGHEYPLHKPSPDRAEQNPEDWWQATITIVRQVTAQAGRTDVAAISFSGQMHGTVLLDRAGVPLHPAIIWADQRSAAACARLVASLGPEKYAAVAGTLPAVGFQGPTLVWLAEHEPALLAHTHQVILPKDYVRLRMIGQVATEVSDAASTGIFDITRQTWAAEILAGVGLQESLFPPVLASTAVAGQLTGQAATMLGLAAGIPVIAGCADQPAQAIGNGLIAPGPASVTTGSGGQVFVPIEPASKELVGTEGTYRNSDLQVSTSSHEMPVLQTDSRLHVFNHAVPQMWYVLGAILSAGLSLRWLRHITGLAGAADAYPILSAEAAAVPPGADGLIFLPYLSGERTPHMDPLARGAFIGLSSYHSRGHLARAVMEGVALALRQTLEISLSLGGQVERIIAAGGGAESEVWRQIQADVFGLPLQQSLLSEQASVGAALLAGAGAGLYPDLAAACQQVVRYGPLTEPNPVRQARYDELYTRFVGLYPRLREDFHWLAGFSK